MSVRGLLAAGRKAHVALMLETCTVTRKTGAALGADDKYVDTFDTVYTGPCRLRPFRSGHNTESGQVAVMMRGYDVQLPFDVPGVFDRGDIVTITQSADPSAVARPMVVTEVNFSGTQTCRHLLVEDFS